MRAWRHAARAAFRRKSGDSTRSRAARRRACGPRATVGIEELDRREVFSADLTTGLTTGITLAGTNPNLLPEKIGVQPSAVRVNALVSGRTLYIEGTDRDDTIVVRQSGGL